MRAVGTQNAWFSFAGHRNDEFDVRMLSMPTRPHPARKGKLVNVPGVDGKLWQDEGAYDRIVVSLRCITGDNGNIDAVNGWLTGSGDLIFGDEPDRAYHARVTKEFSRSNRSPRLRGQEFTIAFDCEPFRYNANPDADTKTLTTGDFVENPSVIPSKPLLRVNGNGAGTLMLGGSTLVFRSITGHVFIDCDAKIAYTGEGTTSDPIVLVTQNITGEWPVLQPGYNYATCTEGIVSVTVVPRWRWV